MRYEGSAPCRRPRTNARPSKFVPRPYSGEDRTSPVPSVRLSYEKNTHCSPLVTTPLMVDKLSKKLDYLAGRKMIEKLTFVVGNMKARRLRPEAGRPERYRV